VLKSLEDFQIPLEWVAMTSKWAAVKNKAWEEREKQQSVQKY
jgi:hypothetical protein